MDTATIRITCPQCGQSQEINRDNPVGQVKCPVCGCSIKVDSVQGEKAVPPSLPSGSVANNCDGDDGIDKANSFLERCIGNVVHAIWGIFRRVGEVARWITRHLSTFLRRLWKYIRRIGHWLWNVIVRVFTIRFAKFIGLLAALAAALACLVGVIVAPYGVVFCLMNDGDIASWIEFVWIIVFVVSGIVAGIRSYRRGALARWRTRLREWREARRIAHEVKRGEREAKRAERKSRRGWHQVQSSEIKPDEE